MRRVLQIAALVAAFAVPAFCQSGRLSPDDQHEFDKAYTKWVNDTRKNDRDDIAKDVRKMQEIMARNNIPANVPYEQVASTGNRYQGPSYQSQLSPQDQQEFDKYYTKWVNDTRKNDRDDVDRDVRKMQEIMARNNIPADVPFDQVASTGSAPGRYENNAPYAQNAPYPQNGGGRLSPEDQRDFDRYYSQWVDDSRRNDRDDAARDMQHLRDIMARNNIPPNIPFEQIATVNANPNNGYNNPYPRSGYFGNGQNRLSPDDQHEFDKAYSKWVKDSRKNDRDDIDKDARKMQDIMARYNIPSDVPYDQIASPNASYEH
ncbi:MAG TPA: hypothetical protein VFO46_07000 [Candidatus Sulfotelmatobacter sp.]|nr:hypothetical protein [Candidatus Sulfotelmatobacter sp.]